MRFLLYVLPALFLVSIRASAEPAASAMCDTTVVGGSAPANAPAIGLVSTTRSKLDLALFGADGTRQSLGVFDHASADAQTLADGRSLVVVPLPEGLDPDAMYTLRGDESCSVASSNPFNQELRLSAPLPLPTTLGTMNEPGVIAPDPALGWFALSTHIRVFANDILVEDILGFYPDTPVTVSKQLKRACANPNEQLDVTVRIEARVLGADTALRVPPAWNTSFSCTDGSDEANDDIQACSVQWGSSRSLWPLGLLALGMLRRRRR